MEKLAEKMRRGRKGLLVLRSDSLIKLRFEIEEIGNRGEHHAETKAR